MDGLFKTGKSGISGRGVFALKKIAKGQTICFMEGELCNLEEMIRRVDEGIEKSADPLGVDDELYLDLNSVCRTFNHSCSPNAFIRGKNELVALRDIEVGEEITYDYSTTMNDNEEKIKKSGGTLWTCKCRCGSKNCRGIIDQFRNLPKATQDYYIKNKFMPDFMLRRFKLD